MNRDALIISVIIIIDVINICDLLELSLVPYDVMILTFVVDQNLMTKIHNVSIILTINYIQYH